jgi:glucuronokinase
MSIHFSIPARINILGNPSDGNEGDFATISAAVELRAQATIESDEAHTFEQIGADDPVVVFCPTDLPLPYDSTASLVKGALNRLSAYSREFRDKLPTQGFSLRVWSDVPRQSGLGGSSLFVLLALAAMREFYNLDRKKHNDYVLSELTQRVEAKELGIACGFADRYVPLFGGLAYLDYRGKLYHADVDHEPYVTYERLDGVLDSLSLVAVTTGIHHDSGDVHGRMRPRYLEEHDQWQRDGGKMPPMVAFMSTAWECAWRGKIALLAGDLTGFGSLMNTNHHIVNEMMRYCGFEDGAGWANNLFVDVARQNGALGAKLTGAGGGGSVFALAEPGEEQKLMDAWRKTASLQHLDDAHIFPISISQSGLVVTQR